MIISLFKKNDLPTLLVMVLLGLLLWTDGFLFPGNFELEPASQSPFFDWLMNLVPKNQIFRKFLAFFLIISQALMINHITEKSKVLRKKRMFPGMIYIILMSLQSQILNLNPVTFANFFLIALLSISMGASKRAIIGVYNLGLFVSIAGLLFFPAYILFFAVFFLRDVFSVVKEKGFFGFFLGFGTPFFFLANYYFHTGGLDDRIVLLLQDFNSIALISFPFQSVTTILISYTAFLFLVSVAHLSLSQTSSSTAAMRSRLGNIGILFFFLLIAFLFSGKQWILAFSLISVPASISMAVWLVDQNKKWVAEVIVSILLGLIVLGKIAL